MRGQRIPRNADWVGQQRADTTGELEGGPWRVLGTVEVSGLFVWHSATDVTLFCSLATGWLPAPPLWIFSVFAPA